jgi:ABC-type nitrate/sulfonate/bicarbonate transport system substrate-binding protein/outer membrane protein OmpA-like peptidoglycan-associated protein
MVKALLLSLLLVSSCASTPSRVCEGEVFGAGVNCNEVASNAQPQPRQEPGPASQPSREPGPSSQPSTPPKTQAKPVEPPRPVAVTPVQTKELAATAAPQLPPPSTAPADGEPVPPMVNVVYFQAQRSEITPDAKVILDRIVEFLKKSPSEKVTLHAFVDPTGQAKTNERLLKERSEAVYKFLVDNGATKAQVDLPANVAVATPQGFPADQYWRLRKVAIEYSEHARSVLESRASKEDAVAEADAHPETPPPEPKKKEPPKKVAAKTPKSNDAIPDPGAGDKKLDTVDVLYWKSVNHALFIIAKAKGYFAEEGLDVRLHSGTDMEASELSVMLAETPAAKSALGRTGEDVEHAEALKKHKYFMGAICPYGFHEGLGKGLPLVQIGGVLAQTMTILMKKDLAEKVKRNLSAFSGHTLGRWAGGPTDIDYVLMFVAALKKNNVPFKLKEYKHWEQLDEAMVKGEIDAIPSGPPYDTALLEKHPDLGIFELRTLYPDMSCCRQVVMREQLRDKTLRDKYVRFERALIKAHRYYREHLLEASDLVAKVLQMRPGVVRDIFLRPGYTLDPNPNSKGAIAFYKTLEKQIGKQDVKEAIDTSIYEEALLGLAKDNPSEQYFARAVKEYKNTN